MAKAWEVRRGQQERFVEELLRTIDHDLRNFSRAPEEYEALRCRLFLELAKELEKNAESNLSTLEIENPRLIFRAPSAMTDVEL